MTDHIWGHSRERKHPSCSRINAVNGYMRIRTDHNLMVVVGYGVRDGDKNFGIFSFPEIYVVETGISK